MTKLSPSGAYLHRFKKAALGTTALSIMVLAGTAAMAAAPAANSLPGGFTTNVTGTTYSASGKAGIIEIGGLPADTGTVTTGGQVLQWGGATSAGTSVGTPTGATATNTGFSVGSGATLTIEGGSATLPTLINDETGSPSQIYGAINASGLGGPLYIANADGVVVGAGGAITAPTDGVGLLGYGIDSTANGTFATDGTIQVDSATTGTGGVTVANGVTVTGDLLVASNGAVSIGSPGTLNTNVLAGYGFATEQDTNVDTVAVSGTDAIPASTTTVALTGGTSAVPLIVTDLYANGKVTNTGDFTTGAEFVPGSLLNEGVLNTAGPLDTTLYTSATTGAGINNTGVINFTAAGVIQAGATGTTGEAAGNFLNSGVINVGATDALTVVASSIDLGGAVEAAGTALTAGTSSAAGNYLGGLTLEAGYDTTAAAPTTGVLDLAAGNIYTSGVTTLTGQAVRVLSGGIYAETDTTAAPIGATDIYVGTGTATDPLTGNTLANNLSLYPGAVVQGDGINVFGTASATGSNINLDGTLQDTSAANQIAVTADNIHGNGGFVVPTATVINATFAGNFNSLLGSSTFQNNYVPVSFSTTATSTTPNVVGLMLTPVGSGGQDVNILVNGSADVVDGSGVIPVTLPTVTTSVTPDHLVVQSTGNITVGDGGTFYWPGLVYLSTVGSTSSLTTPSTSGTITLDGALSNVLPSTTVPSGNGIVFETNALNGVSSTDTITTSYNSPVTFATAALATSYATLDAGDFYQAAPSGTGSSVLTSQKLLPAQFQP